VPLFFCWRSSLQPPRSIFWLLIPVAFAFRLFFSGIRQLVPDEAFYWVLSRHLSLGYLDHPPMVAYVIKVGTLLFGSNELGVRCGAAVLGFGALLVLLELCRRIVSSEWATILLGVMWIFSPLFAGITTMMTPDTPAIFFSVCAMAFAMTALGRADQDQGLGRTENNSSHTLFPWLFFGLFTGLALVSKYTAILPAGAVGLAMLTSPAGRRELRRPGIYLAILAAAIVFSPVVYWNATHQWASFKFQLHHGLDDVESLEDISNGQWATTHFVSLGRYLLGQFGIFTPIFFIIGITALYRRWRDYPRLSSPLRVLVWSATIPITFFGVTAFKSGAAGEANWPAFGYFPMSLLAIDQVSRLWKPGDVRWWKIGCGLALLISVVLHSPDLTYTLMKEHFPKKLNEFFGWKEMAVTVDRARLGAPVIAGRHQDAAELSFYMRGQPEVWVYPLTDTSGKLDSRPTAFDYFPSRPDPSKYPTVLFISGHTEDFCRTYGFVTNGQISIWSKLMHGRTRDRRYDLLIHK
jgi:4-amino-4-deoxy-L-arabinose transferase-like glycosyltransferase